MHDPTDADTTDATEANRPDPTDPDADAWDTPTDRTPHVTVVVNRYGDTERANYSNGAPGAWVQADTDALVDLEAHR